MLEYETPAVFQERTVPPGASLAGYAALVHRFGVQAPVREPSCVSSGSVRGTRRHEDGWVLHDKRLAPPDTFWGHLSFALRHEAIDLLALKRVFDAAGPAETEAAVRAEPTGALARRAWFFHEWLTGKRLDLPDAERGNYAEALDPEAYFTSHPVNSPRHRVRDNLLGSPAFCPVIRRTEALDRAAGSRWDTQAREAIGQINPGVVARAASFLLLADSQASYQIEGERPPRNRLERWMKAVSQAGRRRVTVQELERLQSIVIEDSRFVKPGLRTGHGFIGQRDWDGNPMPEFVSASPGDLPSLMEGLLEASGRMARSGVDPVLQAAATAFGFVFIHPFADGNGRVHRYLVHHVLAERGFTPPGVTFPVSSVLLDRQSDYAATLRGFSAPLLDFIEWRTAEDRNVTVLNDTADLYRFGDYTHVCEFLYSCVIRTVEEDLPREIAHLRSFDEAKTRIQELVEMPDSMLGTLILQVSQNGGRLSARRRRKEYAALEDREVEAIEAIVQEAFGIEETAAAAPAAAG